MSAPKILTFDIETLPLQTYNWSLYDEPRALDRLVQDWSVFAAAAKWLDSRAIMFKDTRRQISVHDDIELVAWLCGLVDEADIVIGQNVQKFDLRKLRARAIAHGLEPFKEPEVIDTLKMAKEIAAFTSHRLEYMSKLTEDHKSKHDKYPGFALWLGIMNNEEEAWEEAKRYNEDDIKATESLYLKLRPWARRHPNLAHYYEDNEKRCPRCGSVALVPHGHVRRGISIYDGFRCSVCTGYCRARQNVNTKSKRSALLTTI